MRVHIFTKAIKEPKLLYRYIVSCKYSNTSILSWTLYIVLHIMQISYIFVYLIFLNVRIIFAFYIIYIIIRSLLSMYTILICYIYKLNFILFFCCR